MTPTSILPADVEDVVARLHELREQLSPHDLATLDAIFHLAGAGLDAAPGSDPDDDPEVEGFVAGLTPDKGEAGNEQVRRLLLGSQLSLGIVRGPAVPPPVPLPYPNRS